MAYFGGKMINNTSLGLIMMCGGFELVGAGVLLLTRKSSDLPPASEKPTESLFPKREGEAGLLKIRQLRARDVPPILFRLSTRWRPKPTRPQLDRRFGVWTPKCCPACS